MGIPRWLHLLALIGAVVALIPPVLIARARVSRSPQPRIHPIPDMDNQDKYRAQSQHPRYEDKRAMRYPVENTIARGELQIDLDYHQGWTRDASGNVSYLTTFPDAVRVDIDLVRRGRDRYDIFCTPCHGFAGAGDGMVANRANQVAQESWLFDLNLHTDERRGREVGHLFNTITNGNNNMPPYRYQIPTEDRWAIVAYVKALQRSENAGWASIPATERARAQLVASAGGWRDYTPPPEPSDEGDGGNGSDGGNGNDDGNPPPGDGSPKNDGR